MVPWAGVPLTEDFVTQNLKKTSAGKKHPDPRHFEKPDPDLHQTEKSETDPLQMEKPGAVEAYNKAAKACNGAMDARNGAAKTNNIAAEVYPRAMEGLQIPVTFMKIRIRLKNKPGRVRSGTASQRKLEGVTPEPQMFTTTEPWRVCRPV